MAHFVYILYSAKLDRYYVGESEDPQRRLLEHLDHKYKGAATGKASDWSIRLIIPCNDRSHARKLELWIKAQKSRIIVERILNDEQYRIYQVQRFQ
ncbi:MAG: GIY-YIG nuclease family protein [Flavobacteriales bacterium]